MMKPLRGLMILAVVLGATGCGANYTVSRPAERPQTAHTSAVLGSPSQRETILSEKEREGLKLKPLRLGADTAIADARANSNMHRVKAVTTDTIRETNKVIAEFNATGNPHLLFAADTRLVRGLNMVLDLLEDDQDPKALKAVAVLGTVNEEADAVMQAFNKSFFKTDAKRIKTVIAVVNLRSAAIQRIYDLSCLATEN